MGVVSYTSNSIASVVSFLVCYRQYKSDVRVIGGIDYRECNYLQSLLRISANPGLTLAPRKVDCEKYNEFMILLKSHLWFSSGMRRSLSRSLYTMESRDYNVSIIRTYLEQEHENNRYRPLSRCSTPFNQTSPLSMPSGSLAGA